MKNTLKWHKLKREERFALWKTFLPNTNEKEKPVLAIGLDGPRIASLARSWPEIHVYDSKKDDIEWTYNQSENLYQNFQLKLLDTLDYSGTSYSSIVVRSNSFGSKDIYRVIRLLEPGGVLMLVDVPTPTRLLSTFHRKNKIALKKYAYMPPTKERLLISLNDRNFARSGLELFTPLKKAKHFSLKIGKMALDTGLHRFFIPRQVIFFKNKNVSSSNVNALDWINTRICQPIYDANIYAGWSKMILQLFDIHGLVGAYAKIADVPYGRESITREVATLKQLAQIKEVKDKIPEVVTFGEWGNNAIQVVTSVGSRPMNYSHNLTKKHLAFLLTLSHQDVRPRLLEDWPIWNHLSHWAGSAMFNSDKEANIFRSIIHDCEKKLRRTKIPFHRVHGDFTPWNSFIENNELKVIDWEDSVAHGLPLSDIVNFKLRSLLSPANPQQSIEDIIDVRMEDLNISDEIQVLANSLNIAKAIYPIFRLAFLLTWVHSKDPDFRLANFS